MIDVRALANSVTVNVNENIPVTLVRSDGTYVTAPSGHRTPNTTSADYIAQVQPLSTGDLKHMDGLNIQGVLRSVHILGEVQGVIRADQKGGDLLRFQMVPGEAIKDWRVVQVMEQWPTWCRVVVVLQ